MTSLNIAIKLSSHDNSFTLEPDNTFADCLREALIDEGCLVCHIHCRDEWGQNDRDFDMVINIVGDHTYHLKPYNYNVAIVPVSRSLSPGDYDFITNANLSELSSVQELAQKIVSLSVTSEKIQDAKAHFDEMSLSEGPLVSILMSTYNRRQYLKATLNSIVSQTYQNWELILINDGGESVQDLIDAQNDSRIKLLELSQNQGKGFAINHGFKSSTGEYIAYLDDDDLWYSNHLEALMIPILTIPGIRMTYSNATNVSQEINSNGDFEEIERELIYHHQVTVVDLLWENHIQGIVVLHSRDLFETVDGMDEELKVLLDWDLWRRLASHTYPYHISYTTAEHFLRTGNSDSQEQITSLAVKNPVAYMEARKHIIDKELNVKGAARKALQYYRNATVADVLIAKGSLAQEQNQLDTARKFYLEAHMAYPTNKVAPRRLGLMSLKNRNPKDAYKFLKICTQTETLSDDPAFNDILLELTGGNSDPSDYLFAAVAALSLKNGENAIGMLNALEENNASLPPNVKQLANQYRQKATTLIAQK